MYIEEYIHETVLMASDWWKQEPSCRIHINHNFSSTLTYTHISSGHDWGIFRTFGLPWVIAAPQLNESTSQWLHQNKHTHTAIWSHVMEAHVKQRLTHNLSHINNLKTLLMLHKMSRFFTSGFTLGNVKGCVVRTVDVLGHCQHEYVESHEYKARWWCKTYRSTKIGPES